MSGMPKLNICNVAKDVTPPIIVLLINNLF